MFRLLFKHLHTIKIPESQLLFPMSKVTLETKEDLWDDEILGKKKKSNDRSCPFQSSSSRNQPKLMIT